MTSIKSKSEEINFDSVWISEHHFLEDGYCPSPAVIAGAMAAVTSKIRIGSSGIILPLHNPVRVAEDAAMVDNISNGRFDLGVVLGYRKEEFEGMGVPMIQRPSRMDEGIEEKSSLMREKDTKLKMQLSLLSQYKTLSHSM